MAGLIVKAIRYYLLVHKIAINDCSLQINIHSRFYCLAFQLLLYLNGNRNPGVFFHFHGSNWKAGLPDLAKYRISVCMTNHILVQTQRGYNQINLCWNSVLWTWFYHFHSNQSQKLLVLAQIPSNLQNSPPHRQIRFAERRSWVLTPYSLFHQTT